MLENKPWLREDLQHLADLAREQERRAEIYGAEVIDGLPYDTVGQIVDNAKRAFHAASAFLTMHRIVCSL